ncbi:hypothetical protein BJ165DRAFT_1342870 [Panaeolus papilionaceus]|nr:hypothetical protein BJ165DRAFT_1342870 [Panaeolus papilionaceus]
MFFSRALLSFFAVGAISTLASPTPAPVDVVEKREDVSDVLAVIDTLKTSTGSILPQIDNLVNTNQATTSNISPLLQNLVDAVNTGTASLNTLQGKVDATTGGTKDQVAQDVAGVITDIANTLNNLKTKAPALFSLVASLGIQTALSQLLVGLNIVIAGVLTLVAGL